MKLKRKPKPVILPAKPNYDVLRFIAGNPVILAATDEAFARWWYAEFRKRVLELYV